jgi:predicted nucleic acid-binding protein
MTFDKIPAGAAVFLDANSPNIQVIPVTQSLLEAATLASQQFELLTGDALVVAVMQSHGLTHLASNDDDFDRAPRLTRYEPN